MVKSRRRESVSQTSAKSRKWPWLVGGAVVILLIAIFVARGRGPAPVVHGVEQEVIAVQVMEVGSSEIMDGVSASGTVRPLIESTVAPKIMSNVAAVYVREGDRVRKGQLLVKLESSDLQAQVAQAEAALSAALAGSRRAVTAIGLQKAQTSTGIASAQAALNAAREQLSLAKEGPRRQQKAQARYAVVQAEAQLKNAKIEMDRMQRLYDQGVVARQRLDGVQMAYDIAKAGYDSAKEQADMAEEGSRTQEIRAAEEQVRQAEEALRMAKAAAAQDAMSSHNAESAASQVAQAKAAVQFAKVQLSYANITAPISGTVTSRLVDPGDTVSPGVPLMAVEDNSLYRLEANVPAGDINNIQLGSMAEISIGSDSRVGQGRVSVIAPSGDPSSRKFLVKVDVPGDLRPKSGDFGRVMVAKGVSDGIVVPESIVRNQGGLTMVFVVDDDNIARVRVVRTGRKLPGGVEVVTGLQAGDRVIVRNTGVLADGAKVRLEGK